MSFIKTDSGWQIIAETERMIYKTNHERTEP